LSDSGSGGLIGSSEGGAGGAGGAADGWFGGGEGGAGGVGLLVTATGASAYITNATYISGGQGAQAAPATWRASTPAARAAPEGTASF
jgi:hypothetical protein